MSELQEPTNWTAPGLLGDPVPLGSFTYEDRTNQTGRIKYWTYKNNSWGSAKETNTQASEDGTFTYANVPIDDANVAAIQVVPMNVNGLASIDAWAWSGEFIEEALIQNFNDANGTTHVKSRPST